MAGHQTIWTALRTAVRDRIGSHGEVQPVGPDVRLDGKVCLVTGASSGLGKAVAIELGSRGANLVLICRPGHSGLAEEIQAASGSPGVELIEADLSDLDSVSEACDRLRSRAEKIHIAVFNAGLMPKTARKSKQGYDLMFAVHFLANRLLSERMLTDGVLEGSEEAGDPARIVFVSSEAHRSSSPIDFEAFARFTAYGVRDGLKYYGLSKLHLTTFFSTFWQRVEREGNHQVKVHALCPGPVASAIAREAPGLLKPIVSLVMRAFFLAPRKAAIPVIYLCCSEDAGKRSGIYLHLMREKPVSPLAGDEENGRQLIEASDAVLSSYLMRSGVQS